MSTSISNMIGDELVDKNEMRRLLNIHQDLEGVLESHKLDLKNMPEDKIKELQDRINIIGLGVEKLNLALKKIVPPGQTIILLKHYENLTWPEIEGQLNITKQTCQTIENKALSKMISIARINKTHYEYLESLIFSDYY